MEEEKKEEGQGPLERWKPAVCMVFAQASIAGMMLFSKIVLNDGMSIFALLTYRSLFGAFFILPFAFFFERDAWTKLALKSLCWISLNAFLGMETLRLCTLPGSLKIIGTLTCFGGTIFVSMYKGKALHLWPTIISRHHEVVQTASGTHQARGTILLVASCFSFACWYLLQSKVLKVYPYKYWSSMMTCLLGGIQTGIVGIILKRDRKAWQLGCDLQLLAILYSGAFGIALKYIFTSYAVQKRGPSYPPMFNALSLVFTTILGSLLLGDAITIGRSV
ncbi:hypothetical protein LUZ61_013632 [Rhynchospora tenuis]|uniref:WAT1-related protein n=1 Tax=Rhynchospora tenuis TaxID=198213 RepID=A0AAD5WCG9_9POAL|nr:hypothetical protein LUZ61_013632 [Rhynchospora tenuis]